MLLPRIIPALLIRKEGLVKTIQFKEPNYVGDPINVVKIFNEKEVDELIIMDIDKTINKQEPNYNLLEKISSECRMPICYGGGVRNADEIIRIIGLGIEKVSISSGFFMDKNLAKEAAEKVGNQSIVLTLDIKMGDKNNYNIYIKNGTEKVSNDIFTIVENLTDNGFGELVLNFIDRDGTVGGYDIKFIKKIAAICKVPLTVIGGAGSYSDIKELFSEINIIGAAAGSIFVYKGKYKAVLINYPNYKEKLNIIGQ